MNLIMVMALQAALQSELVVEVLIRSKHLPGLLQETTSFRLQAVSTTIDSAFQNLIAHRFDLLYESLHEGFSPATTSPRPFLVDFHTLQDQEDQEG